MSQRRVQLLASLKAAFRQVETLYPKASYSPFEIHRGVSFQGVLSEPEAALSVALTIRAQLRFSLEVKSRRDALDARVAIGIGAIDYLPTPGGEGNGPAYRRSGPKLDGMKGERYLLITTPVEKINTELEVESSLLDAILRRWSPEQAEAVKEAVRGLTQVEIADKFNISQPAVGSRLKGAGYGALEKFIKRYRDLIGIIKQKTCNDYK
jgi:hypothetical protein